MICGIIIVLSTLTVRLRIRIIRVTVTVILMASGRIGIEDGGQVGSCIGGKRMRRKICL